MEVPPLWLNQFKKALRSQFCWLLIFTIVLGAIVGILQPKFWSLLNIFDLLRNYAAWGIFTIAQTVVLITGGIDVSFTAVATVSLYCTGLMMINFGLQSVFLNALLASLIGCSLGFFNGLIVYLSRVNPVIVTIGTLNLYYNLLIYFTQGKWLYALPNSYLQFGLYRLFTVGSPPTGLSVLTILWLGLALISWLWLKYTAFGRTLYAVGGNLEAARRAGYRILGVTLFTYCYAGFLNGFGGFAYGAAAQFIQPNALIGRELDVIAAAILGGGSIFGGRGTALGSILGTLLIGVVRNSLILVKVPSYWHSAVIGGIILAATIINAVQELRKTRLLRQL